MSAPMLRFAVLGTSLSFRAKLSQDNPSVVALIRRQLPLDSVLGHVVISGETFWMPTRIVSLTGGNMVERVPGSVYFYAPGQTICVCYGHITESAKVNQFGQVLDEDFESLKAIGKLVLQQTVENETPAVVRIQVSLIGITEAIVPAQAPVQSLAPAIQCAIAAIEEKIEQVWLEEPDEIKEVRSGLIRSGAGTGGQFFSVLVHLEAYFMMDGADILFRLMKSQAAVGLGARQLRLLTKEFFVKSFNHFEFLGDLGVPTCAKVGHDFVEALDTVKTVDEYIALSSTMLTYITRIHRWVHLIFPWHLGKQFPHRAAAELASIPKLIDYVESA